MPQSGTNENIEFDLYNIGDTKEYVQFAIEIERTLHKMQKEISNCLEPKKVALHIMRVATEFYNADWCGILDIDTEVGVFTPIWWYDTEFGEMGQTKFNEFEYSEKYKRWIYCLENHEPVIIPDIEEIKEEYESRKSLIANYIRPLIGDMKLEDISPRIMDKYYRDLLSVKSVVVKNVKPRNEYLTPHTVREIHKVLRNAFNQAVKWELMTRNPVEHATLPKEEHKTRDIWTAEVLLKALEACDDDILRLAINLAFSCSLRMGELLGLTWDCVDISPASIELGQASIFVEKELQRVNREAMADLNGKDIMFKFPPTFASTHTALVLKTPKTKTSVRKVFLPRTVAEMLVQRKAEIEELKDLFGDEFIDFNLVFCSSNGKPIEGQVINRAFNKLIEENGLPKVVFHSLRHSSITYKLKLNGGDMKSVQGDSGHAQVKMVADVYSHIIDDDRRLNAERLEAAFYSGRQATPEPVQTAAQESSTDDKELLLKLLQNPEMAALLKSLAKTL